MTTANAFTELDDRFRQKIRRARLCHWERFCANTCKDCGCDRDVNILRQCQFCCWKEKLGSLSIVAEPAALREVRRQYGHAGESGAEDNERKYRRSEERAEAWAKKIEGKTILTREQYAEKLGAA